MPQTNVVGHAEQRSNQINLNPIRRIFVRNGLDVQRQLEPYVSKGQVVADLGCGSGYCTLALAARVGPEGRVHAVDLKEGAIRQLQERATKSGCQNIEFHVASAASLGFIKDRTIDFVLANGLLCTMPKDRQAAVQEIERILKPGAHAYLALGSPPPLGHVHRAEWEGILARFKVLQRGGTLQKWALVSLNPSP
jgi:ubiquinone/menaquinone biosynthesis C-methylase UbiE